MKCSKCGNEFDGKYCKNCYTKPEKSDIFSFEDENSSNSFDASMYQRQDKLSEIADETEQSKVFNFDDEDSIEPITDYNPYPMEEKTPFEDNSTEDEEEKPRNKKLAVIISITAIFLVLLSVLLVIKLVGSGDSKNSKNSTNVTETTVAETTTPVTNETPATIDEITPPISEDYYDDDYYEQRVKEYNKLEDGHFDSSYGYFHKDSGFYYRQTTDGLKITGFNKFYDTGTENTEITIKIPSEINGLPVTDIDSVYGMYCLSDYVNYYYETHNLKNASKNDMSGLYYNSMISDVEERIYVKLIVPHSVRTIRGSAFSSSYEVDEIVIEDGVKMIEENAFLENYALKKLTIPPTVTYMEDCMAGLEYDYDSFYSDVPKPIEGFTIYGDYGSVAQEYANKHEIPFEQV